MNFSPLFYHTFKKCNKKDEPLLDDTLTEVIQKIGALKRKIEHSRFSGRVPSKFTKIVYIDDEKSPKSKPITNLLKYKQVLVNLKQYLPEKVWLRSYRWRVSSMKIHLLDKNKNFLKSLGDESGQEVEVVIIFPNVFTDIDKSGKEYKFQSTFEHFCKSVYITQGTNIITRK